MLYCAVSYRIVVYFTVPNRTEPDRTELIQTILHYRYVMQRKKDGSIRGTVRIMDSIGRAFKGRFFHTNNTFSITTCGSSWMYYKTLSKSFRSSQGRRMDMEESSWSRQILKSMDLFCKYISFISLPFFYPPFPFLSFPIFLRFIFSFFLPFLPCFFLFFPYFHFSFLIFQSNIRLCLTFIFAVTNPGILIETRLLTSQQESFGIIYKYVHLYLVTIRIRTHFISTYLFYLFKHITFYCSYHEVYGRLRDDQRRNSIWPCILPVIGKYKCRYMVQSKVCF